MSVDRSDRFELFLKTANRLHILWTDEFTVETSTMFR